MMNAPVLLKQFDIIRVDGEDAAAFLQGQLTCDVLTLEALDSVLFACCDHKGRVFANGWLIHGDDHFGLLIPKSMMELLLAHLKKYAVFSKVGLRPAKEVAIVGIYNDFDTSSRDAEVKSSR
ncbi:unnamed protein product, partial [marine sediment metagenome]